MATNSSLSARDSELYRTMHRQPAELRRLHRESQAPTEEAAQRLIGARRLYLVGIGTSYHAALAGAWMLRAVGVDAQALMSPDFADYPGEYPVTAEDGVIILAHSGTKTATSRSLARAVESGAPVVSIGSRTAEHPGSPLILRTVDRETSAAFTASHTAAMFTVAQIATHLAVTTRPALAPVFADALAALPDQVQDVLARERDVEPAAQAAADRLTYATGAGPSAVTALEVVIKVREAARAHIDGLPLEQFLHGPLVVVNAEDFAIIVNVQGAVAATTTRTGEVAGVLAAIGTPLWVVGQAIPQAPTAIVFELPEVPEPLSTILSVVPMHILAEQVAAVRGVNPDRFRRDEPRYAEALGTLSL